MVLLRLASVVSACLAVLAASPVTAEIKDLMRRVPRDANMLMIMDVQAILQSPMGVSQQWASKRTAEYQSRPLSFPPETTKLVRAASFDADLRQNRWEVALLESPKLPTLPALAKRVDGYLDTVGGVQTVWSPRGWYAIKTPTGLGALFPPNRQVLSGWVKEPPGQVSQYLLKASQEVSSSGPQLLLVLDLEDVVKPQGLKERLQSFRSLAEFTSELSKLEKTLMGLRGVRFSASFGSKATGKLVVEFDHEISLASYAKPLLLEVMQDNGVALDDLESWEAKAVGKEMVLQGELSTSSLLRLGSLFDLPSLPLDDSGRDAEQVDAGNPKLYATQNYFKSVDALLKDLREKRPKAKTFGELAMWADQYAKRIGRLSMVNVDPDMLDYSERICELMRKGSGSLKGIGIGTAARQSQVYNYDYYGYNVAGDRRAIAGQERAAGAAGTLSAAEQIDEETRRIRREMTERYKVEF